jgi:uncharacterized Tic20 family protein
MCRGMPPFYNSTLQRRIITVLRLLLVPMGIVLVVLTIGFVQVLSAIFGWGSPLTLGVTLLTLLALTVEFVVVFIRSRNKMRQQVGEVEDGLSGTKNH